MDNTSRFLPFLRLGEIDHDLCNSHLFCVLPSNSNTNPNKQSTEGNQITISKPWNFYLCFCLLFLPKQISIFNPLRGQSFQKIMSFTRDTICFLSLHISFSMRHLSWRDSKNIKQVSTFTLFFLFLQHNCLLNNRT